MKKGKKGEFLDTDLIEDESSSANMGDIKIDLDKIFRQMKKRERSLLWMAHAEGYTHQEISRITGLNEKSIKVILFRLRKKFAGILRKSGFDGG